MILSEETKILFDIHTNNGVHGDDVGSGSLHQDEGDGAISTKSWLY